MQRTPLFARLYLAKLSVDHAYALVHSAVALAQQASLHFDPLTRQAAQYMADCNVALEANLKTAGTQDLTGQIRELDAQCGDVWAAIRRSVKYYGQDGTATQQAAAKEWQLFLQPYGKLPQAALNTQMALVAELCAKYLASATLRQAAEVLGLQHRMQSLQTLNQTLMLTYRQRNTLATAHTRTNTQLKVECLAAYRRFCSLLEQACLYTASRPLLDLVAQLNGYRTNYQTIIARRKATAPAPTQEHTATATPAPHPNGTLLSAPHHALQTTEQVATPERTQALPSQSSASTSHTDTMAGIATQSAMHQQLPQYQYVTKMPTNPTEGASWHREPVIDRAVAGYLPAPYAVHQQQRPHLRQAGR